MLSIGDSYLRHFHVALKLILTNDYIMGGTNGKPVSSCLLDDGQGQFAEKDCRGHVATSATLCEEFGNPVTLDIHASEHPNFNQQQANDYDIIIWGHGNHVYFSDPSQPKLDEECFNPTGRTGTMDWTYHKTNVFPTACGWHKENGNFKAKIFWFPPHQTFRDEGGEDCPKNRRTFAQETSKYVKEICNIPTFMEEFTVTDELVKATNEELKKDIPALTYDRYHWSRVVNLIKAQTFLHFLKASAAASNTFAPSTSPTQTTTISPTLPLTTSPTQTTTISPTLPLTTSPTQTVTLSPTNSQEPSTFIESWTKNDDWCSLNPYYCSKSNFTYSKLLTKVYDKKSACELLKRLNVKKIFSLGDSYQRHFHVALKLILTDNFLTGGANGQSIPSCLVDNGEGQFAEKDCRGYVASSATLCEESGNPVTLDIHASEHPNFNDAHANDYDIIIWGHGNHVYFSDPSQPKLDETCFNPTGRTGTMDWIYAKTNVFPSACGWHKQGSYKAKIFWFPPHQTLRDEGGEDCPKNRRKYAHETSTSVKDICDVPTFMEQFTLTDELVNTKNVELYQDLPSLTYDNYHWKRVVNLAKAQTFLQYLDRLQ